METGVTFLETKKQPVAAEVLTPAIKEVQKTLNLIIMILLFLLFILPTSVGFTYRTMSNYYILTRTDYVSFLNGLAYFFRPERYYYLPNPLWAWIIPLYLIITLILLANLIMESKKILSMLLIGLWLLTPAVLVGSQILPFPQYQTIQFALVSLPYCLLSVFTILKVEEFIQGKISFIIASVWILLPVLAIIPGGLILNLLSAPDLAASHGTTAWFPIPVFSILLFVVMLVLEPWVQTYTAKSKDETELEETSQSNDMVADLG